MKRFTQEEAMAVLLPGIQIAGAVYEKFVDVDAVEAGGGEHVVTVTSDGKETENTAEAGDFIITNPTEASERYVVRREKFLARHEPTEEDRWHPTGMIRALCITADEPFTIEASWGEDMPVKPGDYLATPLPEMDEVYRIAAREFGETLRPAGGGSRENASP